MTFVHARRRLTTAVAAIFVASVGIVAGVEPGSAQAAPPSVPATPAGQRLLPGETAATEATKTGKAVEVTAVTSPVSRTVANPSGTFTTSLNPMPVRVKQGGRWVGLDANLHRNADGSYSPNATAGGLTISGGGSTPLAIMVNGDERLTVSWPTKLPTPTVSGTTVTYPNVASDVDLKVTASEQGGFSHVLVIKTAEAVKGLSSASVQLVTSTSSGLHLTAKESGLEGIDRLGRTLFTAPSPVMWDSSTAAGVSTKVAPNSKTSAKSAPAGRESTPSTATEPGSDAKIGPVGVQLADGKITLTPDRAMLTGPETTFPVYVDPSWNPSFAAAGRNAWTYVSSAFPKQAYLNSEFNDGIARAGYQGWQSPRGKARSFFQFGIPSSIHGTSIKKATFQITEVWSSSNQNTIIDLKHTCRIDGSTSWNHQPCLGDHINSRWVEQAHSSADHPQIDFDVSSEIRNAADGRWGDTTIGLFNQDENDRDKWRKFDNNPTIAIEYNSAPNTPINYTTSPAVPCSGGTIGNTAVTLSAQLSDPDGSQGQIEANFSIIDATDNRDLARPRVTVSSQQYAAVTLQADQFVDGHQYKWNVWATDGKDNSASTPVCWFTMNRKQPAPPVVTSTTYPAKSLGAAARTPGAFKLAAPAGTDTPVSYVYSLNTAPPDTIPRQFGPFNGGTLVQAAANGAATRVTITPSRLGANILYVYAINAGGNPGPVTAYTFVTDALTTPDRPGDLTGDGLADLLTVGTSYRPGLWLYRGTDTNGKVNSATQVGAATKAPTDWNGSTISTADFDFDGTQDLLVKRAKGDADTGNVELVMSGGDGLSFAPDTRQQIRLQRVNLGEAGYQTVDQIAVTPLASISGSPLPDVYAVVKDHLYIYVPGFPPGSYLPPTDLGTGWAGKTITGIRNGKNPALFVRDNATGQLTLTTGNLARGVPAGAVNHAIVTTYAANGFAATNAPTITGTDINADNHPDLWTTTNAGVLNAHISNTTDNGFTTNTSNTLGNTGLIKAGHQGWCLDNLEGRATDGNRIQIYLCNGGGFSQIWTIPGDGTVRIAGKCLDVDHGGLANGTKVWLWTCHGHATQQWEITADNHFKNPASGRCLDNPQNALGGEISMQIYDCNDGLAQRWTLDYTGVGAIRSEFPGKCIDDQTGGTNDGNPIVIHDCNGSEPQRWVVLTDGTIRNYNRCMDVSNNGNANNTKVQIWTCNGSSAQQWQIGPNNSLIHPSSGKCLDIHELTNYTQLQIFDCNNTSPQRWLLPQS